MGARRVGSQSYLPRRYDWRRRESIVGPELFRPELGRIEGDVRCVMGDVPGASLGGHPALSQLVHLFLFRIHNLLKQKMGTPPDREHLLRRRVFHFFRR